VIEPGTLVLELGGALARWMATQRWFRAKGSGITHLDTAAATTLLDGDPALVHLQVIVDDVLPYQLVLGLRTELPDFLEHAFIGRAGPVAVYDAIHDGELMAHLLDRLATDDDAPGLRFRREPGVALETGLRARPIGVEQSNSSIVFGSQYILKLYRQPAPGPARDVELHRILRDADSQHISEPLAVMERDGGSDPLVLGFLQRFLSDAVEGWATATASVRDLLAEADLHADEVGGDFAGEAHRLGVAVAQVHAALAGSGTFTKDDYAAGQADQMHARLTRVLSEVPELAEAEPAVRAAFDEFAALTEPIPFQHVHGDLHLGQVLRTTTGWVLIDFEGEPAASPLQRRQPRSPLYDVAGMLRSFDYAAFHLLAGSEENHQLLARATEWADRNRAAFCDGYAEVAGDPREQEVLLRALELDKAVYEVSYEHHNRPDWLPIPLAAIGRRAQSGQTG
jgi:maltokinase